MTPQHRTPSQQAGIPSPARLRYTQALLLKSYDDALLPLQTAIADNDARAMGLLGTLYMLGHGVAKDEQEAYLWFRQGAVRGDLPSQTALGLCLAAGRGTPVNRSEAVFWLSHAALAGTAVAIEVLSWLIRRHPSLVGEQFSHAQLHAVFTRTPSAMTETRAAGWAVCLAPGRGRQAR